jgi:hypothetical protein
VREQMRDIAEVGFLRADVAMQRDGCHCVPVDGKDRRDCRKGESAMQLAERAARRKERVGCEEGEGGGDRTEADKAARQL